MKRFLLLVLVGCTAHADISLRQAGTTGGPVIGIECVADGGLACSRETTTGNPSSIGKLRCAPASLTTPGCVSTEPQTFNGSKNIDGGFTVNGNMIVDGGVTAKSSVSAQLVTSRSGFYFFNTRADGGQEYLEGDDPAGSIGFSAGTYTPGTMRSINGIHVGYMQSPGTAWDGTNTRSVMQVAQAWTAKSVTGLFGVGIDDAGHYATVSLYGLGPGAPGTGPDGGLGGVDGGVCFASFRCVNPCPDAGAQCGATFGGQCDFAAGQIVYAATHTGQCSNTMPSTTGLNVYGQLQP